MAEIRDTLRLDIDQALRQVQELENALNRALSQIVVDVEVGPGAKQLEDDLKDAARVSDDIADDAARIDRELRQADDSAEKLDKEMRDVARATDKAADQAARFDRETKQATKSAGRLGTSFKGLAAGVVAGVGLQTIVSGFNDLISSASNLEESINAVSVQFGDGADIILDFGLTAATSVGLATSEFNQLAVVTGALFNAFIDDQRLAAEETIKFTQRATDLASVFNVTVPEALEALQASLRGEQEAIRRFGVIMDEAAVKAKGLELGLAATEKELTTQDRSAARLAIIYEQTNKVAGDFANTQGSVANKMKVARAEFETAKAVIGDGLIPVMLELLDIMNDLTPALVDAAPGFAEFVGGAIRATKVVGGLVSAGLNLATATTQFSFFQFGAAIRNFEDTGRALEGVFNAATNASDEAAVSLARLGEEASFGAPRHETVNAWEQLQAAQEGAAGVADQFAGGVRNAFIAAADAEDTFREASRNAAFEMAKLPADDLVEAMSPVEQAFDDAAAAVDEFRTSTLKLADPVFAAVSAQEDLVEATENLAELEKDPKATIAALAGAKLEVLKFILEADAAKRALGDISAGGGPLDRLLDVAALVFGETREEIRELIADTGVFRQTVEGDYEVTIVVDDQDLKDLDDRLSEFPRSIDIFAAFRTPPPTPTFLDDGPIPEGSSGGGFVFAPTIVNPTTNDLAGDIAQGAMLVSTIPGILNRVK